LEFLDDFDGPGLDTGVGVPHFLPQELAGAERRDVCGVVVDGVPNTRACMMHVVEGMDVRRQDGLSAAT